MLIILKDVRSGENCILHESIVQSNLNYKNIWVSVNVLTGSNLPEEQVVQEQRGIPWKRQVKAWINSCLKAGF